MRTTVLVLASAFLAQALPQDLPIGQVVLQSASNPELYVRHCDFQAYAISGWITAGEDYNFTVVPALNGASGAVSFQSNNYPTYYLAPNSSSTSGLEPSRIYLLASGSFPAADASFAALPGLSNSSIYSFKSLSAGPFGGQYLSINNQLSGVCSSQYPAPAFDLVLGTPAAPSAATWNLVLPPPVVINVDASSVSHQIPSTYLGCHSDSGFTHQPRGYYSQLIYGEVFEFGLWPNNVTEGTAAGILALDSSAPLNGFHSLKINFQSGAGVLGLTNRGIGNHGLVFQAGQEYEGYFFAVGQPGASVNIVVRLVDTDSGTVLASQTIPFTSGSGTPGFGEWSQLNFSLTPSASTNCVGIDQASNPNIQCGNIPDPSYLCFSCNGEFQIGLSAPGQVNINYVYLQPGQWARLPGQPVLTQTVQWLQDIGVTAIRQGGSFTQASYYEWKNWIGPAPLRPSLGATWGASLISGWGPIEMANMCEALNFTTILTTSMLSSAQDFADLVSYLFGDASNNEWAAARARDGHIEPYNKAGQWFFELGNEQDNFNFPAQVAAMEAQAASLGMAKQLVYMYPNNPGPPASLQKALLALGLGDNIVTDIHVGAQGGVEAANNLFASNPAFDQGAVNCETNAGTHDFTRGLQEAADMNDFFNANQPRLKLRTASFCTTFASNYDAFSQGLIHFLPNMTWAQPPAYVHKMIKDTFAANMVNVTSPTIQQSHLNEQVSASLNDDSSQLVLRIVNNLPVDSPAAINISGVSAAGASTSVWCLQSNDMAAVNTPGNPTLVSPVAGATFNWNGTLSLPPQSYCIYTLTL